MIKVGNYEITRGTGYFPTLEETEENRRKMLFAHDANDEFGNGDCIVEGFCLEGIEESDISDEINNGGSSYDTDLITFIEGEFDDEL